MPDFLDQYTPQIKELIGNIDDVYSLDDFDKAMEKFGAIKQYKQDVQRFGQLKNKYLGVDLNSIPMDREVDTETINPDYLNLLPEDMMPSSVKEYTAYQDRLKGEDGNFTQQPIAFDEYIKTIPGYYDDLKTNHPGAFKTVKQKQALTDEELQQAYDLATGMTPEEIKWYKENEGKFTPQQANEVLMQMISQTAPTLQSSGSLGNTLSERYKNEGMMQMLNDKKTEYKTHFDNNGNMIYFDPTDPTKFKVVQYGKGKSEFTDDINKVGYRIVEKDGKYVYQFPSEGGWVDSKLEATPEQYDAYNTTLTDKGLSYEDKREINSSFKTTRTPRRRKVGSNNVNFGNFKPGDFSKMTIESLDKLSVGDLSELKKYKKYLPNDVKREFEKRIQSGSLDTEDSMDDNTNTNSQSFQYAGELLPANDRKELYDGANEDEKQALANVESFFNDVVTAWGRNDLTPEEWRNQIGQQEWTDLEYAIVKNLFKKYAGEEI